MIQSRRIVKKRCISVYIITTINKCGPSILRERNETTGEPGSIISPLRRES